MFSSHAGSIFGNNGNVNQSQELTIPTSNTSIFQSMTQIPFWMQNKSEAEIQEAKRQKKQNTQVKKDKYEMKKQLLIKKYASLMTCLNQNIQQLKCINGNQAALMCSNIKCQQNSIMCGSKKCECIKNHKSCFCTFQPQLFLDSVERKLTKQDKLIKQIQKYFDNLVDDISDFQQQTIKNVKYMLFQKQQNDLIYNILEFIPENIIGKKVSNCVKQLQNPETINKQDLTLNQIREQINTMDKKIKISMKQFQNLLKSQKLLQDVYIWKNVNSRIITQQYIPNLISFFNKNLPKRLNLLYRGSEHKFQRTIFFHHCSNIENTLQLFKLSNNQIVGGFTPRIWKHYDKNSGFTDNNCQTFLFELKRKIKYTCQRKDTAIFYARNQNPCFGFGSSDDPQLAIKLDRRYSQDKPELIYNPKQFKSIASARQIKFVVIQPKTIKSKSLFNSIPQQSYNEPNNTINGCLVEQWQVFQLIFE